MKIADKFYWLHVFWRTYNRPRTRTCRSLLRRAQAAVADDSADLHRAGSGDMRLNSLPSGGCHSLITSLCKSLSKSALLRHVGFPLLQETFAWPRAVRAIASLMHSGKQKLDSHLLFTHWGQCDTVCRRSPQCAFWRLKPGSYSESSMTSPCRHEGSGRTSKHCSGAGASTARQDGSFCGATPLV